MLTRTTNLTVTFRHPFVLDGFDYALPAGTYTVETVEEMLEGLSFPAYRSVSSSIRIPPRPDSQILVEVVGTNLTELNAALVRDAAATRDACDGAGGA